MEEPSPPGCLKLTRPSGTSGGTEAACVEVVGVGWQAGPRGLAQSPLLADSQSAALTPADEPGLCPLGQLGGRLDHQLGSCPLPLGCLQSHPDCLQMARQTRDPCVLHQAPPPGRPWPSVCPDSLPKTKPPCRHALRPQPWLAWLSSSEVSRDQWCFVCPPVHTSRVATLFCGHSQSESPASGLCLHAQRCGSAGTPHWSWGRRGRGRGWGQVRAGVPEATWSSQGARVPTCM